MADRENARFAGGRVGESASSRKVLVATLSLSAAVFLAARPLAAAGGNTVTIPSTPATAAIDPNASDAVSAGPSDERQLAVAMTAPPVVAATSVASAQITALEERLDAVEQHARATDDRASAADLVARKDATKDATRPQVGADEKGFALRSTDNAFVFKIKGFLAVDGRRYFNDPALTDSQTFTVRKIRPIFDTTMIRIVDLHLLLDFADSKVVVFDAWVDVNPTSWLKIRAGKLVSPIGMERWQIDGELSFMERSLASNLTATRDVGLLVFAEGAGGLVQGVVGAVDGAPDNAMVDTDTNQGKDLVGRLRLQPFKLGASPRFGTLVVGVAGSLGDHKGQAATDKTGLAAFKTPGQVTFFQYLASATDATAMAYANGRHTRVNPQLFYGVGPIGLLAEYTFNRHTVQRGTSVAVLDHRGATATLTFVLGGKPSINGTTVTAPFDPSQGNLGALEVAVRYSELKLDSNTFPTFADPTKSAGGAQGIGASASWYASRNLRISTNYEQSFFSAAPGSTAAPRPSERALLARTQVVF